LFVLAAWLPATEHCALEAAGLVPQTCRDDCSLGQRNGADGCSVIEGAIYKPSTQVLKVLSPELLTCACHLCLQMIPWDAAQVIAPASAAAADRPRKWTTAWHFVRRAAPLPGAPSRSLA